MHHLRIAFLALFSCIMVSVPAVRAGDADMIHRDTFNKWLKDPAAVPELFPIAVWAQSPARAAEYKEIGVNLYISLYGGPTEGQLDTLRMAGMPVICHINEVGLRHRDDPLIWAWMHGDEPDNAQSIFPGWEKEYKDKDIKVYIDGKHEFGTIMASTHPSVIQRDYWMISNIDTTRPVYLNLGYAVAVESSPGRGLRSTHLEDYKEYVKGGDIVSYDIYPLNDPVDSPHHGKLELVGRGVERLRTWSNGKPAWCWIECTKYNRKGVKPTPAQVRSEVWIALTHGARGFGYFCHIFQPEFNDAGPLADPEMKKGLETINAQVRELAPVLNSPTVAEGVAVESETPVKVMVKKYAGATYVFAVSLGAEKTDAEIRIEGLSGKAEALYEDGRTVKVKKGMLKDSFGPYQVHLYKIK